MSLAMSIRDFALLFLLLLSVGGFAVKKSQHESLDAYVERMQQKTLLAEAPSLGSLWIDSGRFADSATDYKAGHLGDLVTVVVVQDVTAQNAGSVATARTFNASSSLSTIGGESFAPLQNLFTPASSQSLTGKAQASTTSSLRTRLTGRVVAVLSNGSLVVEAERQFTMNNEKQTVQVRGLVRRGDIAPDNTILTNQMGNLELELKGKGVISDGIHPTNAVVRAILRLVGF